MRREKRLAARLILKNARRLRLELPGEASMPALLPMRFGNIAIVGRANVGKSTFLNAALGQPLAIVSPLPQTTRDALLGIVTHGDAQLAFLDTPGLHRAKTELGRRMNATANEAARAADAVLFVTDPGRPQPRAREPAPDPEDLELLKRLPPKSRVIAAINKVDLVKNKERLLPLLVGLSEARPLEAVVPVTFRRQADVTRVLDLLGPLVPEGEPGYDEETLTDRPSSYFAREYVREAVLESARGEVPHAVAVSLDEYDEAQKTVRIRATIHVEKVGQRKILVGSGGAKLKEIGTRARKRIEGLIERPVFLGLFVRVTPQWKSVPRQLAELGYGPSGRGDKAERRRS
jgi:GTP-binding protein Era